MKYLIHALTSSSLLASSLSGAIITATDASFATTASPDDIRVSNVLQTYTNSQGSFTNLSGVTEADVTTGSPYFRAYWAIDIADGDRKLDSTALLGMDIGYGVIDLVSADFQFGGLVGDGDNTNGNDIVLFEIGSLDAGTTIVPLNSAGDVIGDFTLSLGTSNWGTITQVIDFNLIADSGNLGSGYTGIINAVGFDLGDFTGTGELTGVTGIRITSSDSLDLGIAAATVTPIPEPQTYALLSGILALAWIAIRQRQRQE
ncbi:hypothetical protein [Coraliomargarita parva]|uniref:hypothetical protein n=1 Tax=Coraliomargarita parva TaxID=3014050 RepID=UPI0022B2C2D2|nr:hypothetical protein [Coraliomargarita parva]